MRAVVDTNVFVSGLLGSGACRKVFLSFKENRFKLVISEVLFEELKFILERPKFQLLIDSEEKGDLVSFIDSYAIFVKPKEKVTLCRDVKDNKILECALEAKANIIVTGDADLLVLESFQGIPIVTSREFLSNLTR